MERIRNSKLWFTLLLVGLPALVHGLFEGSYIVDPNGYARTFWIGPVGTTIPFVFLALLFLAHCARLTRGASASAVYPRPAYWGAALAWSAMMAFTLFLISQTPGPDASSTMGIAVVMTPFFYLPLLLIPYAVGAIVGSLWGRWNNTRRPATV